MKKSFLNAETNEVEDFDSQLDTTNTPDPDPEEGEGGGDDCCPDDPVNPPGSTGTGGNSSSGNNG